MRETQSILQSLGLPIELVLNILDYVRYEVENSRECTNQCPLIFQDGELHHSTAFPYLCVLASSETVNTDGEQPKLREIEFP